MVGKRLMAKITIEAWSGTTAFRLKLKDDTTLDQVMTKIEHGTPLRGVVDDDTKRPAILMPCSCSYFVFEEE